MELMEGNNAQKAENVKCLEIQKYHLKMINDLHYKKNKTKKQICKETNGKPKKN
jgi:hypothetical protein